MNNPTRLSLVLMLAAGAAHAQGQTIDPPATRAAIAKVEALAALSPQAAGAAIDGNARPQSAPPLIAATGTREEIRAETKEKLGHMKKVEPIYGPNGEVLDRGHAVLLGGIITAMGVAGMVNPIGGMVVGAFSIMIGIVGLTDKPRMNPLLSGVLMAAGTAAILNPIAGAVLGGLFALGGLAMIGQAIFSKKKP